MHQVLLTIAVAQTFFAALILVLGKKEERSRSAALLGGFVFVYGVSFFQELELFSRLSAGAPFLVPLSFFFYFLIGPTFYFYIKDITKGADQPLVRNWPLHIAPIVLGVLFMSAWVMMSEDARQSAISNEFWPIEGPITPFAVSIFLAQMISHIQVFSYLMGSLRLLYEHLSRIRDLFSNLENKTLGWLRLAILALTAIWFTDLVTDIGYIFGWFGRLGEIVFTFGELMLFYFVTICGLRQPTIIVQEQSDATDFGNAKVDIVSVSSEGGHALTHDRPIASAPKSESRTKYAKSALDETHMKRIAEKLEQAMVNDRLFTDSSLTLADLSKNIRTPQNYVSQTLNQQLGLKFYDYIARHRIEAAKAMLSDNKNGSTVLSIALDVGFNSKSTFNAAFKRIVGSTPSQFRQEQHDKT